MDMTDTELGQGLKDVLDTCPSSERAKILDEVMGKMPKEAILSNRSAYSQGYNDCLAEVKSIIEKMR